jgi:hypothetical protein
MKTNKVAATLHKVLANSKLARNSDRWAILEVWEEWGLYLDSEQVGLFMSLPSVESIRRTRQKMQEQGLYPADKKVQVERGFKAMSMQQRAPSATPDNISNVIDLGLEVEEKPRFF